MGRARQVVQISYYNDRVIKVWESISLASEAVGVAHTTITNACKGTLKSAGGYRWRYKDRLNSLVK